MKKTYIHPEIIVFSVQMQEMIAESAGFGEGTKEGSEAVSRRRHRQTGWDDEDWDDEEY